MTKTEYREYLSSPEWQGLRKEFLANNNSCVRCNIPRWLAEIAYDQDLNVHHVSYSNLGNEDEEDLEPLCRRCHEIEKFGRSDLREPKSTFCELCTVKHWNYYSSRCDFCTTATSKELRNILHILDNKLDGCYRMTVDMYLASLLILHHEGVDGVIEVLRFAEPYIAKAQQTNDCGF